MNRKAPQTTHTPLERLGLQTLLIGMEATLDAQLSALNDVRDQLGHPQVSLLRNPLSEPDQRPDIHHHDTPERQLRQIEAPPVAKKVARPEVASQWKRKSAILRAAGWMSNAKGMPSNALIAKAEKKLKRLGIPIPDGTEPATATTPQKKTLSARTRKLVGASSKARWDLMKRAGLHCSKLPSNKDLAKARRILGIDENGKKISKPQVRSAAAPKAATAIPADIPQEEVQLI